MILWVASYPRSGNTLVRIMLKEVFGCRTYSRHHRPTAPAEWTRSIHEVSGIVHLEGTWPEAYARMAASKEVCLVKTHEPPEDSAKAVYVARNGFAAIISYQCYLRDLRHQSYSLEDIIAGKALFGSWGSHLDIWQPFDRPNTLLLTYEDLVQKPEEQIAKLSAFCGLRPLRGWTNEFDKHHALIPAFFRKGQTGDASGEFSKAQQELFWSLHGDWMQRLGYAAGGWSCEKALPRLRKSLIDYLAREPAAAPMPEPKGASVRQAIAGIFRKAGRKLEAAQD